MTDEQLAEGISSAVDYAKEELVNQIIGLVKQRIDESKIFDVNSMLPEIDIAVGRLIRDQFQRSVANEIGNRLRCGIYDGTKVDSLFESVWTEQLDVAIKDRIRQKVREAIDSEIAARLKSLKAG